MLSRNASMSTKDMLPLYTGVFIVSLSTLIVEISLTRIFSVTIWHHFAFMVISIALLGFGASGSLLTVFWGARKWDINSTTTLVTGLFALVVAGSLLIISRISLDPFQILDNPIQILKIACVYALLIIPFFLSGLCTSFILTKIPDKSGQIYFCSLTGSGMGCLLSVFTIPLLSNAGAIMFSAFSLLIASLDFNANKSRRRTIQIVCAIIVFFPLVIGAKSLFEFEVADSKSISAFRKADLKPEITTWNAFSRIDVYGPTNAVYSPGLSVKYGENKIPRQMMIFIDADANTPITQIGDEQGELDFFMHLPSSLAYQLKQHSNICIIGAGGGFDVLTALMTGSPNHVTAVELNGDIIDIVRHRVDGFAGSLYNRPDVTIEHAEGRRFIRNCRGAFDIIQISLVDTWAAASTGAYSLAENYLYTTEAFVDYISRLAPDGILTFTRWLLVPPKECLRLAAIAVSSLEEMGVRQPENNMVFVGSGRIGVLLLKKLPFTKPEVERIQEICTKNGFNIIYAPMIDRNNIFSRFILSKRKASFYNSYPLNIESPTDDKPFYFHYYTWDKIRFSKFSDLFSWYKEDVSYLILLVLLGQAVLFSALLILLPLAVADKTKSLRNRSCFRLLFYFACLGLGFMFIEVTLVQKFILFLGHPVYSLSVVISSLLIFAGLGSWFTSRMDILPKKLLMGVLVAIASLVLAYSFILSHLSHVFFEWNLFACVVISILFLAPLGFLIGMPFPIGLRLVSGVNSRLVPWAWGVNGCFSVISSILSVILAMGFGFSVVLQFAAVVYLFASLTINKHFSTEARKDF